MLPTREGSLTGLDISWSNVSLLESSSGLELYYYNFGLLAQTLYLDKFTCKCENVALGAIVNKCQL